MFKSLTSSLRRQGSSLTLKIKLKIKKSPGSLPSQGRHGLGLSLFSPIKNLRQMIFSLLLISQQMIIASPIKVFMPTTRNEWNDYPYISADSVRTICDHKIDHTRDECIREDGWFIICKQTLPNFNPALVNTGDTVFLMVDYQEHFFKNIHPLIKNPYIIVTHHYFGSSDNNVPGSDYHHYLDDDKIIAWFSHNIDCIHPKLKPLPIGLGAQYEPFTVNKLYNDWVIKAAEVTTREKLLYMNFTRAKHFTERNIVYPMFEKAPFCTVQEGVPFFIYLENLTHHKFVLSPRGNGEDCFRTWEALLMKCYPIVKSSAIDELYKDLPVVVIEDWSVITPEFLEKKYQELNSRTDYKWEKLYMDYWIEEIKKTKEDYLKQKEGLDSCFRRNDMPAVKTIKST